MTHILIGDYWIEALKFANFFLSILWKFFLCVYWFFSPIVPFFCIKILTRCLERVVRLADEVGKWYWARDEWDDGGERE